MRILSVLFVVCILLAVILPHAYHKSHPTSNSTGIVPKASPSLEAEPFLGRIDEDSSKDEVRVSCASPDGVSYHVHRHLLVARDQSGAQLWTRDEGDGSGPVGELRDCAVAHDGTIYETTVGDNTQLLALTPAGDLKWRMKFDGTTQRPAIAADGTVYVRLQSCGGLPTILIAVNSDGVVRWKLQFAAFVCGTGSPVIIGRDGTIYLEAKADNKSSGPYLVAAVSPTGMLKWQTEVGNSGAMIFGVAPNGLIIGSGSTGLFALNPDGRFAWTLKVDRSLHGGSRLQPTTRFTSPART